MSLIPFQRKLMQTIQILKQINEPIACVGQLTGWEVGASYFSYSFRNTKHDNKIVSNRNK